MKKSNVENPMRSPRVAKVVVNMAVGDSGEKLIKAETLMERLIGKKPVRTISTHRIPAWGIKKGDPLGCKATLRGDSAIDFLKRGFIAKENQLKAKSFDKLGNFSFGIAEYIDIPGIKYDPEIGIFGMDVTVTMERPGYRIKRRRILKRAMPVKALLTREESIEFIKNKFGVTIT